MVFSTTVLEVNVNMKIFGNFKSEVFLGILFCLVSFICGYSQPVEYVEDWADKDAPPALIRDPYGKGDYLHAQFIRFIDKNSVRLVLEIGSRDAIDALELSSYYHCHVFAFECNPTAISICAHNRGKNPNVSIIPFAAWSETTKLTFHPVIPGGEVFSLGASSIFPFDPNGPVHSSALQGEIIVDAIRVDEWLDAENLDTPDLICIDAQGATLPILEGLKQRLSQVKYIIAEAEIVPYYIGESLYPEIVAFMCQNGFVEVTKINHSNLYADVLFVRKDLVY